jgi:anti-anti-sigma factor
MAFEAVLRGDGAVPVLDLHGEIDGAADSAISSAYADAVARGTAVLVLNFDDVSYINSTGIALIVGILAQARKSHVEVVAYGLTDHYREIFEITRLAEFVAICPDEASAVARAEGGRP